MTDSAFGIGIRKHRNGVVANHAPVVVAHVRPHGQQSVDALLAVFQHGLHHIGVALRLQHVEERMQGAVGVPKREHGIVGKALGLVDIVVEAAVLAISWFPAFRAAW